MSRSRKKRNSEHFRRSPRKPATTKLRIIGGSFRGRQIEYSGDPRTRPMKDNVREALFNLVGAWVPNRHALDLFAGTGAVGLEALSRGAIHATFVERHFPSAAIIRDNVRQLDVQDRATIITADTFFWVRRFTSDEATRPDCPWMVFCCPPYDYFVDRLPETLEMIRSLMSRAPRHSLLAVESDNRFDPGQLPQAERWRVKQYATAQICVLREKSTSGPLD